MSKTRNINLKDFLTDIQIGRAFHIYVEAADQAEAQRRIRDEIIAPNMTEIDRRLGQENDAGYLSYVVVYTCQEAWKQQR